MLWLPATEQAVPTSVCACFSRIQAHTPSNPSTSPIPVHSVLIKQDVLERDRWTGAPPAQEIANCYHGNDVQLRAEDIILQVGAAWGFCLGLYLPCCLS